VSGWRLLLIAVVIVDGAAWGGLYTVAKATISSGAHPLGVAIYEGLGAGVLLLAICLLSGRRLPIALRDLRFYLINGLLGVSIPAVAIFFATEHLPVGIVTLFFALVPVMTYGFALVAGMEGVDAMRVGGIICGLLGMVLIVLPDTSLPDRSAVAWVLIGFAACSCYAVQSVYIAKRTPVHIDTLMMAAGTMLCGGGVLLPIGAATGTVLAPWPPDDPIVLGLVGVGAINCAAILLFFWLIRVAGPVFAVQTGVTTILAGVLFGYMLFDERLSLWVWGAIALMALGVMLVQPRAAAAKVQAAAEKRL
jgi:drug/metabolite transporter (DMT)-like permease